MTYVKGFIFTLIVSLLLGFGLAYLQEDKEYETTIEVKTNETKEYVKVFQIGTFPKIKIKYNEQLTGRGKAIFESELYTPIFMKVEAPGYKTKRGFYLLNASEENVIFLEESENKNEGEVLTDEEEKSSKPTSPEESGKKVDMLPTFK